MFASGFSTAFQEKIGQLRNPQIELSRASDFQDVAALVDIAKIWAQTRIALVFCYTEIDMAENFGPERYAPPHLRPPKDRNDVENVVELLGKQRSDAMAESASAENVNVMIRRMAIDSMEDIDRVIRELESVRDMLRNEGARVSREVSSYASLNHATATAMKVIAESLNQWKERPLQNKEAASDPR